MSSEIASRRNVRSFVLREGHFTDAQSRAYSELWPHYGYDFFSDACLDPKSLFASTQPVCLEIGFGNGETLIQLASANPKLNFLGIEVHRPGIGRLFLAMERNSIKNIRVLRYDAAVVIKALPMDCLAGVYILFPDPWPKKRHHKRRLVQPEFITNIAKTLIPGGFLHLATDWEDYAHWMLAVLSSCPELRNSNQNGEFITRPQDRPLTHFEQRGQRLGHKVYDLLFYRDIL